MIQRTLSSIEINLQNSNCYIIFIMNDIKVIKAPAPGNLTWDFIPGANQLSCNLFRFLAAMSSSRSDVVTLCVHLCVRRTFSSSLPHEPLVLKNYPNCMLTNLLGPSLPTLVFYRRLNVLIFTFQYKKNILDFQVPRLQAEGLIIMEILSVYVSVVL